MAPYSPIAPITASDRSGFVNPVTALSFDPVSDILWGGSTTGIVSAYYGVRGLRGVAFPVGGGQTVTKIIAGENYVRATGETSNGVGSWAKSGANTWYYRALTNVCAFTNASTSMVAASMHNLELAFLDSTRGQAIRQVPTSSLLTQLEPSQSALISGSMDGYIRIHDVRTDMSRAGASEAATKAHTGKVEGLQVSGNFIFSIGMGERQGHPFPDPLVRLYDVRNLRPLTPVPFASGPAFIHAIPKRSSGLAVISHQGLVNILDASDPSASHEFYQLDVASYLTSSAISPSGTYMAFGDADGVIHLLSQAEEQVPFNGFEGNPYPWADTPAPLPDIEWSDSTPLNSIGMPYFDEPLFSSWPRYLSPKHPHYPPPPTIPPTILLSMKTNDNIAYAALPKELKGRRNMVTTPATRQTISRFRSGKTSSGSNWNTLIPAHKDGDIPRAYCRVEIEYSKFGVEDFDFDSYNETSFSGLETHILNCYTNSLIQVLHYTIPLRNLMKAHISIECPREHCFLCELGFISRMLEDARGKNCQASNFCKTVGVIASGQIQLLDYGRSSANVDYSEKIQSFHRFLYEHVQHEARYSASRSVSESTFSLSPINRLLGLKGNVLTTCLSCGTIRQKDYMSVVVDLLYPGKNTNEPIASDFSTILHKSLIQQLTHKATCSTCRQQTILTSRRTLSNSDLPAILALNASIYNDDALAFWHNPRGQPALPSEVHVNVSEEPTSPGAGVTYEVRAFIVNVVEKNGHSHLVAVVKIPENERSDQADYRSWYLFNDFVVTKITQEEALDFRHKWKIPSIIYLERLDLKTSYAFKSLKYDLDPSVLSRDTSISRNRDQSFIQHRVLRSDELPKRGTLVAIDAEFVLMQQEETEFKSDGTKKVLRPARMSLARVSVLRGSGPSKGVPFIDDHIHTSETIVDYLTEYSGIKPGDLDPSRSRYTLTPLKIVYKKLRLLVDRGCIFIGHGLSKDFRIINIFVPPEQVIDTVNIWFIESRQRRLSLRFLSWYILGEHIQTQNHDSIEDARSALRLYDKAEEMKDTGEFDDKLDEVYKAGRQYNFKPPTQ